MLPPPVTSTADLCDATRWPTRVPPGHELVVGPDPRPCVPPPPDDRLELLRAFILDDADGYKKHCAKVLIARAALDDREAWEAIARDLDGPGRGNTCDVAEALATGDLDKAVAAAALVCGDIDEDRRPLPEKWCREMRAVALADEGRRAVTAGQFTREAAKAWMRAEADCARHGDGDYDVTDGGELSATKLAESCADHFGVNDEGGPLDDDGHWIWEVALEVVDERTEADDEEECDDF